MKKCQKSFYPANYLKRNGLSTKVRQFFFSFATPDAGKTNPHSLPLAI